MDTITIPLKQSPITLTKRKLLQYNAIFDPMGWISPTTLPLKIHVQEMWKAQLQWDEKPNKENEEKWKSLISKWQPRQIQIPRWIETSEKGTLHVFVDASQRAYAAAIYWISETKEARGHLIFSKCLLAPTKPLTIPRLELMAILIGVRALAFVQEQAYNTVSDTFLWSDSQATLNSIRSDRKKERFVQNRLNEIRRSSAEFRYVPTKMNPTDVASRGCNPEELIADTLWWHGPSWLGDKKKWPKWDNGSTKTSPEDESNRDTQIGPTQETRWNETTMEIATVSIEKSTPFPQIEIETERFHSWNRLLRTTSKVLEAVDKWRKREMRTSLQYQQASENIILRKAQKDITNQGNVDKKWMERNRIHIQINEEGLIYTTGRLTNAGSSAALILLPRTNPITKLIILHHHQQVAHAGTPLTLTRTREKFWFAKGRNTVKKAISKCTGCIRWRTKPFQLPPFPPWPKTRVTETRPFQNCGIDYWGPVNVKTLRENEKRWIAIFTCFATRAVHMEVAKDTSALEFTNVARRFFARRGVPNNIYSDHGTQFESTKKALDSLYTSQEETNTIKEFMATKKIEWNFTTPYAPWKGGIYERLIGMTKKLMRPIIGKRLLTDPELETLVTEIEGILNSRPITQVEDSPDQPLRPIDFLLPKAQIPLPIPSSTEDKDEHPFENQATLIERWRSQTTIQEKFWRRWKTEYLQLLRERQQHTHKGPHARTNHQPRIGEIVIIEQKKTPRGCWPLGTIEQLNGTEQIRSAIVKVANGHKWERPINQLYPLEVTDEKEDKRENKQEEQEERQEEKQRKKQEATSDLSTKDTGDEAADEINISKRRQPQRRVKLPLGHFRYLLGILIGSTIFTMATSKFTEGIELKIPPLKNCSHEPPSMVTVAKVKLYERNAKKTKAYSCFNITRTVCTRSFLRFTLKVVSDELTIGPIGELQCITMIRTHTVEGHQLHQVQKERWKTRRATEFSYALFGERCTSTTNFELDAGIVATMDDTTISSELGRFPGCEAKQGICQNSERILVWDPERLINQCKWKEEGTYQANVMDNRILITSIQASFVVQVTDNNDTEIRYCTMKLPITMENGFLITIEDWNTERTEQWIKHQGTRKGTRSNDLQADAENIKFQYSFDVWREEFKRHIIHTERHACKSANKFLILVKGVSKENPSLAARILLNRDDIVARWQNEKLIVQLTTNPVQQDQDTSNEEMKEIIFDGKRIQDETMKRTALEVEMLDKRRETWQREQTGPTTGNVFDDVEKEAEQLGKELDIATEKIEEVLRDIMANWHLGIIAGVILTAMVIVTYISYKCRRCLRRRERRRRPERQRREVNEFGLEGEQTEMKDIKEGQPPKRKKNERRLSLLEKKSTFQHGIEAGKMNQVNPPQKRYQTKETQQERLPIIGVKEEDDQERTPSRSFKPMRLP